MCSEPVTGSQPTLPEVAVECPLSCKMFKQLGADKFQILENGTMAINGRMRDKARVHDYCVTYSCPTG